jgi:pyruvate/2-oxoglutarate dehydrogenase complex dihydrolipoamide acyltransferase (E2) component
MTMMFDHDVIDGSLAARFAARLTELLQNGFGLTE